MLTNVATFHRGEPKTIALKWNTPVKPTEWASLTVNVKDALPNGEVPPESAPVLCSLTGTLSTDGSRWFVSFSAPQSQGLTPGLKVLDGRIRDSSGNVVRQASAVTVRIKPIVTQ